MSLPRALSPIGGWQPCVILHLQFRLYLLPREVGLASLN